MLRVSAVIPTYNGVRYLAEAVRSAMAQTCELLEIIVVDDGSREEIEKILSPFYPRVRYVRQDNAGPAAARNRGIALAQGDVIAFLDDDDIWHPEKTARQMRVLLDNPHCALVYSFRRLIDEDGNSLADSAPPHFPSGSVYREFLSSNRIATPSATLVRKRVVEEVGGFDENREYLCGEDYDLWLRIARDHGVMFCPGELVSYRVRAAGISRDLENALKGDFYVFKKEISRHARDPKLTDREFYGGLDDNRYHTLRRFAFLHYYERDNRVRARELMLSALGKTAWYPRFGDAAVRNGLATTFMGRCPYRLGDILFATILALPDALFHPLRNAKRHLAAAVTAAVAMKKGPDNA
jgi:glycosyltransferase involved in cell wall biosynthesis